MVSDSVHAHTSWTLPVRSLDFGVLMLVSFNPDWKCCQADSCSNFTFLHMLSEIGNSRERLLGTDAHTQKESFFLKHTYSHTSSNVESRMQVGRAEELQRLDVTGLIIEGCPPKLLHMRAQKIKLSYQWAAQLPPQKTLPCLPYFAFSGTFLSFYTLFLVAFLKSRFGVRRQAFQLCSVSILIA